VVQTLAVALRKLRMNLPLLLLESRIMGSRDSSVGIATRLRDGGPNSSRGSIPGGGKRLSSPQRPDRLWGPLSLLSNGYRGTLSLGVKRRGEGEAEHSPPSTEVKNGGAIPPFTIRLHGVRMLLRESEYRWQLILGTLQVKAVRGSFQRFVPGLRNRPWEKSQST
jgi:hypothetical protein